MNRSTYLVPDRKPAAKIRKELAIIFHTMRMERHRKRMNRMIAETGMIPEALQAVNPSYRRSRTLYRASREALVTMGVRKPR